MIRWRFHCVGDVTARQIPAIAEGDQRKALVAMGEQLGTGESLATATVTEETTSDLTISNVAVSGGDVTMRVAGQLKVTGLYTLKVVATTNAGARSVRYVRFEVGA